LGGSLQSRGQVGFQYSLTEAASKSCGEEIEVSIVPYRSVRETTPGKNYGGVGVQVECPRKTAMSL